MPKTSDGPNVLREFESHIIDAHFTTPAQPMIPAFSQPIKSSVSYSLAILSPDGCAQELKDLRRAGVRTFAEADAYEVEHRRRRAP